jgi:acetyltransferase-like isoleucine patch superfamily enzyme
MDKYKIPGVQTFEFTKIIGLENIDFGKNIIIDDFVLIYAKENIKIGSFVHISSFTSISGGGLFEMGDFSGLSSGCRIITGSDDYKEWGFGNPTVNEKFRNCKTGSVRLGNFSIVGANSVILPNVDVGEGVTVGAGSVVSKNLEPWGIYIGNRKVGERDKEAVLANYHKFLNTPKTDQVGKLFQ